MARGDRLAEPVAVAYRQTILLGASERGVAVFHVERRKDVALNVGRVRFAACGLDDQPQQAEVDIAVFPRCPRRACGFERRQSPRLAFGRGRALIEVRQECHARQHGKAAGLVEQVTNRHCRGGPRIRDSEPWQVALDGRIQINLPLLHQLHHRQRRDRLGCRAQHEGRLRSGRFAAGTRAAKAAQMRHPVAFDNRQRHAGDLQQAHLVFDVCVNRFIDGGRSRGAGCHGCFPSDWREMSRASAACCLETGNLRSRSIRPLRPLVRLRTARLRIRSVP